MPFFNFDTAGHLLFGSGAVARLGERARLLEIEKILVVTDPVLRQAGLVDRVTGPLQEAGIRAEVYDGGEPEPSLEVANAAAKAARSAGMQAVLGLGGGSNLDVAKAAAAILAHGGSAVDFMGVNTVPGPVCPLIAIPTTAGTGSEVSQAVILTDEQAGIKLAGQSDYFRPALALVDPELTLTCPAKVTADSGIDALTHAIEAYTNVDYREFPARLKKGEASPFDGNHPLGDALAEKAVELIGQNLRRAVREPENLQAREGMALAATLAGMAFSTCGVAVVHALEYPIGAAMHISHGEGNGQLLPFVMRYNLPYCRERVVRIGQLLGAEVTGLSAEQAAEKSIEEVSKLSRDIGIPQRLREFGVTEDMLEGFSRKSYTIKRLMRINPRVPTRQDLLEILQDAF